MFKQVTCNSEALIYHLYDTITSILFDLLQVFSEARNILERPELRLTAGGFVELNKNTFTAVRKTVFIQNKDHALASKNVVH